MSSVQSMVVAEASGGYDLEIIEDTTNAASGYDLEITEDTTNAASA